MKLTEEQRLQKRLREIQNEKNEAIAKIHFPEFQKMIGKCFKRRNSYSCPKTEEDYWWLYDKITDITEEDVYYTGEKVLSNCKTLNFQTDCDGRTTIEIRSHNYVHSMGEEITTVEFETAYKTMLEKLQNQL